jgi:hypothetical protein
MLATKPDIKTSSNIEGEVVEMALDTSAMGQAHLASVLSNMYSDPRRAVLREYSTNAWDAHNHDGIERPIEVTLPTSLDPMLKIRDFGRGLDREAIRNIYSKYGTSESRNSETATGALGLGSKSALTYSDSFVVVSVKDGKRIQVSVSKTQAMPTMTIMSETDTDEESGTMVMIPTNRYDRFDDLAHEFFRFWPKGSVLVDGKSITRFDGRDDVSLIGEDILVEASPDEIYEVSSLHVFRGTTSYIVMGRVAYPIKPEYLPKVGLNYGQSMVAFMPVTAVDGQPPFDFAPSREDLMYTARTKACLAYVAKAFTEQIVAAIQREIDESPNRAAALRTMLKWSRNLGKLPNDALRYQGDDIPTDALTMNATVVPLDSYRLKDSNNETKISVGITDRALYLTGYDRLSFTATQKKKLVQYYQENDLGFYPEYFILLPGNVPPVAKSWIDKSRVHKWADVQAIKLPRASVNSVAGGRIPGSYDCYIDGNKVWEAEANSFDLDNPVFYVGAKMDEVSLYTNFLNKAVGEYTLVPLSPNRINKFKRLFPDAENASLYARRVAKEWFDQQSKADLKAVKLQDTYGYQSLKLIDPAKVEDPDLKRMAKAIRKDLTDFMRAYKVYARFYEPGNVSLDRNPLAKYHLWSDYAFRMHPEHVYTYLNAAYNAEKGTE